MSYEDRARRRIALWLDTHPKVTQRMAAEAAGHLQPWVSSYRKGLIQANLDELAGMASAFGHTLTELLDLRPDVEEQEIIDAYRSLSAEMREHHAEVLAGDGIDEAAAWAANSRHAKRRHSALFGDAIHSCRVSTRTGQNLNDSGLFP